MQVCILIYSRICKRRRRWEVAVTFHRFVLSILSKSTLLTLSFKLYSPCIQLNFRFASIKAPGPVKLPGSFKVAVKRVQISVRKQGYSNEVK